VLVVLFVIDGGHGLHGELVAGHVSKDLILAAQLKDVGSEVEGGENLLGLGSIILKGLANFLRSVSEKLLANLVEAANPAVGSPVANAHLEKKNKFC